MDSPRTAINSVRVYTDPRIDGDIEPRQSRLTPTRDWEFNVIKWMARKGGDRQKDNLLNGHYFY